MFGILDYICWILGLIFTIFWIFLFCKGKINATLFQGLDEKEYPLKDIYFVGYELLELIKYNYRTKYDRRLRKEISVLKDGKYAELWNMQQGIYRRRESVAKQPVAAAVVEDDDDGEAFTY